MHRVYLTTDETHLIMPVIWGMELVQDNLQQLLKCNKLLAVVDDGPLQDKNNPTLSIISSFACGNFDIKQQLINKKKTHMLEDGQNLPSAMKN